MTTKEKAQEIIKCQAVLWNPDAVEVAQAYLDLSEWVSIKDRLPEEGELVALYFDLWSSGDYGHIDVIHFKMEYFMRGDIPGSYHHPDKVTRWMSLSDPSK